MDKVRIGIIGCGGIANGKHLPALKRNKYVEMVAFCDIVAERAEKAAAAVSYTHLDVYKRQPHCCLKTSRTAPPRCAVPSVPTRAPSSERRTHTQESRLRPASTVRALPIM